MPSNPSIGSLRQQAISGASWTAATQIGRQLLQFIISVNLARLLTPHDFGLLGMLTILTGFAAIFSELGLSAALVQREQIEQRHLSTAFWLNLTTGALFNVLFVLLAQPIATFYGEQQLFVPALFISLNFTIGALGMVQRAILTRRLDFRIQGIVDLIAITLSGGSGILLAYLGYGVYSLVWSVLIGAVLGVIGLWMTSSWRPQLIFDRYALQELWRFSLNLVAFQSMNYWARNADNFLIGRLLGSTDLGLYSRAYSLMLLPMSQITGIFGAVMFPVLSRLQTQPNRVKDIYLRTISLIALFTFPMMSGLLVISEHFVIGLLGPQWAGMIPVFQILCLVGMVQSIASTVGWIYQSQGRTDWMVRWGILAATLTVLSFGVGIWLGSIVTVAWCYTIYNFLLLYWNFAIPGKLIGMAFLDVVNAVRQVLICAALMALCVWLIGLAIPAGSPSWLFLAIQIPAGIAIYIAALSVFRIAAFQDMCAIVSERIQRPLAKAQ